FTRGKSSNPFVNVENVNHIIGNRNNKADLVDAYKTVAPDIVIDMVALVPQQVEMAVDIFADVHAYILISSGAVYAGGQIPYREDESPLLEYTEEEATDDMPTTINREIDPSYGSRKAECDRIVYDAAADGVNAIVVRPSFVFGPYDYTERMDYWIDRVANHNRILIPGDGDYLLHTVYAPDVASAVRIVAERGSPGEAYNVADRMLLTRYNLLELIANCLGREIDIHETTKSILAEYDLHPTSFPLTLPFPFIMDTSKLERLGWTSTNPKEAIQKTVDEHLQSSRSGRHLGPARYIERNIISDQETSILSLYSSQIW
ncbi:MAG: NAD-dependent epimerase/dehydratase family protein, partial [Halobacteriaceae archaeon]